MFVIVFYINKILFGFWGLTFVDMIHFIDLSYLDFLNSDLKEIFTFLGLIYFTIQIPFKIINLNHKRKMDKVELQKKSEELDKN